MEDGQVIESGNVHISGILANTGTGDRNCEIRSRLLEENFGGKDDLPIICITRGYSWHELPSGSGKR